MKKIILTTGGTGGHVFPAIALLEELRLNYEISIITDKRGEKYLSDDITYHIIDSKLNRSNIFSLFISIISISRAILKSLFLLHKLKPKIIIAFGGYPTFSILVAAVILNIDIILHEPNSILGKVNRLFVKVAKYLTLAYENTKYIDSSYNKKAIIIGDLIRNNIKSMKIKESSQNEISTIFVFGGSQGAKVFSKIVPEALNILVKNHPEIRIRVIQQVKEEDKEQIAKIYSDLGISYELASFFHNIEQQYAKSDLVISRSGSSTIAELRYLCLPAIVIPYPYSAENHQYYNAKAVKDIGGGWCLEEKGLTGTILSEKLFKILKDKEILKNASKKLLDAKKAKSDILVKLIEKIIL